MARLGLGGPFLEYQVLSMCCPQSCSFAPATWPRTWTHRLPGAPVICKTNKPGTQLPPAWPHSPLHPGPALLHLTGLAPRAASGESLPDSSCSRFAPASPGNATGK